MVGGAVTHPADRRTGLHHRSMYGKLVAGFDQNNHVRAANESREVRWAKMSK